MGGCRQREQPRGRAVRPDAIRLDGIAGDGLAHAVGDPLLQLVQARQRAHLAAPRRQLLDLGELARLPGFQRDVGLLPARHAPGRVVQALGERGAVRAHAVEAAIGREVARDLAAVVVCPAAGISLPKRLAVADAACAQCTLSTSQHRSKLASMPELK